MGNIKLRRDISIEEYKKKIGENNNREVYLLAEENYKQSREIITRTKNAQKFFENGNRIYDEITNEFLRQTKLNKIDYAFVFLTIALQCTRIYLINQLTKIEKAGAGNKTEAKLHSWQDKLLGKFGKGSTENRGYYASLKHIISTPGVPYDVTAFREDKFPLFKGANHRFSTLGHDPVVGLIFGTGNIMTNTITTIDKPLIRLNHVLYDSFGKNPRIGEYGSNIIMLEASVKRAQTEPRALVAALIKQIIHIGTDMYTPCGIQLPFMNLTLAKENVDTITKYIGTGDLVKWGGAYQLKEMIDMIVSTLHLLCNTENISYELYACRTKKIINIADIIAEGSNVIMSAIVAYMGDVKDGLKVLDIGGIISTIKNVIRDVEFIAKVENEFISKKFIERIKQL